MKICIITNTFSPDLIGGSNIYTSVIVREFLDRDHEVVVISASPQKKDSIQVKDKLKVYYFHPMNISTSSEIGKEPFFKQGIWTLLDIYNRYSYSKIFKILKAEAPDIVHLHTPLDITLAAFDAVKKMDLPLVFTAHDYLLLCRRVILLHKKTGEICTGKNINKLCKPYRILTKKITGSKADVVIFPSEFISGMFKDNGFFKKSKKVILPYPIKLGNSARMENRDLSRAGLNILYVGSLTRHKGIQVLIQAVKSIKSDALRLTIVGSGRYKNKLEELSGGDTRITFTGKILNDEIACWYKKSDVLVVPSVWNEVFGIVILEAFRAGIPVIASGIGGITEVVKNNFNGFIFEQGNIEQLRQIIEKILKNPEILAELGKNALDHVRRYEMSGHIKGLLLNYGEAARLNKTRGG